MCFFVFFRIKKCKSWQKALVYFGKIVYNVVYSCDCAKIEGRNCSGE